MSNTGPAQLTTDPTEPIPKDVNFYVNPENGSLEKITVNSKEGDETVLFPITLESGEKYIPDFDEFGTSLLSEGENTSHLIHTDSFEIMERDLFHSVKDFDFEISFLQFAKENLSIDYDRLIVEETAVHQHLWETDLLRRLPNEIFFRDCNRLIMHWPDYYPGRENYDSDFLPTTKELFSSYLFNKLAIMFNNRKEYDLKIPRFDYIELQYLRLFINDNYENEPSEIFNKIQDHHHVNSRGIYHMTRYIEIWEDKLMMDYRQERHNDALDDLPIWRKQTT